jgi:hypothetical protein
MNIPAGCEADHALATGNPFSTRHVRPGRIPPLGDRGEPLAIDGLLARLDQVGGSAAIRGPHGSGKTTLLEHLATAIQHRGTPVVRMRLRTAVDVPAVIGAILRAPGGGVLCIDSWDCMGRLPAAAARLLARARRCSLIVTTHRATSLPLLAVRATTPELLVAIVRRLPGHDRWGGECIGSHDIDAAFARSGGNLREALYELYDRFERCERLTSS